MGYMLGENYVIDPTVQGAVSMQTTRALSKKDLLPTLEGVAAISVVEKLAQSDRVPKAPAQFRDLIDLESGIKKKIEKITDK